MQLVYKNAHFFEVNVKWINLGLENKEKSNFLIF